MRLSRNSSLTRRELRRSSENCGWRRSSASVCGRLLKAGVPPGSRPTTHIGGRLSVFYATGDERTFCLIAAAELVCEPQSTFDRRLLARFGLRDSNSRSTADGSECG